MSSATYILKTVLFLYLKERSREFKRKKKMACVRRILFEDILSVYTIIPNSTRVDIFNAKVLKRK